MFYAEIEVIRKIVVILIKITICITCGLVVAEILIKTEYKRYDTHPVRLKLLI